ncbi:MAG: hypothetical protein V4633_06370 [Pseudomonadota bacterium]
MSRFLFAVLLFTAPFASAVECAPKGITEITVKRAEGGALATYRFGKAIACLKLGDRGDVRKLTWQVQTAGATLSEDGNVVQFAAPRKDFSVLLRAFERDGMMDRVYSPVIAFGDGSAVAVYTSYLRPETLEQGIFLSFNGFAPTAPARKVGPQRIGNEQTYIILGQPTLERRGKVVAAIDKAMPAWLRRNVVNSIAQGEVALRSITPSPRPLAWFITYTDPDGAHANWRGDTLDKLVRLNFMGAPWQQDMPDMKASVDQFILHEMFHTVGAPALDTSLPGAMTLGEGGAEAGGMAMRRRFAAGAGPGMAADIDNAIARCQKISGKTLAEKEQKSQHNTPYVCGMALQFMVAAAARQDPLDIWQSLLRKAKPLSAGWPQLLAAAAEKDDANRAALAVLDDMTSSKTDWDSGIARLVDAKLLRRLSSEELAAPLHGPLHAKEAIFHMLTQYCSQRHGFNTRRPVYPLDAPAGSCGIVPDQFRLLSMNGLRLDGDAYRAHQELTRRCVEGLPVILTDDQGTSIELACKKPPKDIVIHTLLP